MITVDTNVLVYRVDSREAVKRAKAQALLHQLAQASTPPLLLWQALIEFVNQMQVWRRQQLLSDAHFDRVVHDVRTGFAIVYPTATVMDHTLRMISRYSLSYFDALLLGACIDAGIDTLYTEDMGAPAQYDSVQLINPFV